MQWNGIKNGALFKLLDEHDFDFWIVVDKNIPYQQNVAAPPCVIIVLDVFRNTLKHISPLIPSVLLALQDSGGRNVIVIAEAT